MELIRGEHFGDKAPSYSTMKNRFYSFSRGTIDGRTSKRSEYDNA